MVLLKEDEEKQPPSRKKRWFKRITMTVLLLAVFFWIGLVILARIGGDSEALHEGLESFLARLTGLPTQVETFHGMTFYPQVTTFAEDITMRPAGAPEAAPVVTIGSLKFARSFWDIFFSRQTINDLQVEGLSLDAGILLPHALTDATMAIRPDVLDGQPGLSVTGTYGGESLDFSLALDVDQSGRHAQYSLPAESRFSLSLGALEATGHVERHMAGGMTFHVANMSIGGDDAYERLQPLQGTVNVKRDDGGFSYTLNITRAEDPIEIRYDDHAAVDRLSVTARRFDVALLPDMIAAFRVLRALYAPSSGEGISLGHTLDFTATFEELLAGQGTLGTVSVEGRIRDQILKSTTLSGTIADGELSGDFTLDAAADPAHFAINLNLKQWDYAALQAIHGGDTAIHGKADAHLHLTANGASYDALWSGLNGEILALGAGGRMAGGVLDSWGNGILHNLLPDFRAEDSLAVNCLMMRFDVEQSIASTAPFFLDTGTLTITGEGQVFLNNRTIDMLFIPDAKGFTLGTAGPAVRVEGPLSNPAIAPDTLSLGKQLGTLLLGTVNPAFWAWSLADIGLGENHPCRQYLDEDAAAE